MPMDFNELSKVQRKVASTITKETKTEAKIKLLTIIGSLTTGKKKRIQKEAIILEAENYGLTENDVMDLIDELEKDGIIQEEDGFITFVP